MTDRAMPAPPERMGIYDCLIQDDEGISAECCLWDGVQWQWWFTAFDPVGWDPVADSNCVVVGWRYPVRWDHTKQHIKEANP